MSWTQGGKRMGSGDARAMQAAMKRQMPDWDLIIPAIERAFEKLRRRYEPREGQPE